MSSPLVCEKDGIKTPTDSGMRRLEGLVTNAGGDVYAISGMPPVMAAAGMARLSRSPHDMRVVILDEFTDQGEADQDLLRRVISQFGDDSVQQLVGLQMVVEGASQLLTKMLEWGRLGAYLEQSTRYIYFDQKDVGGQYRYLTPEGLESKLAAEYRATMDQIFDLYSEMVRGVTEHVRQHHPLSDPADRTPWLASTRAQACDAVRPVLPVATKSTVGLVMSAQSLDELIMRLMSEPLPEANRTADRLLEEARKLIPAFLERTDRPDRGLAKVAYKSDTNAHLARIYRELVPDRAEVAEPVSVRLLSHWPGDETEVIGRMLYAQGDLPLSQINRIVRRLPRQQQDAIIRAYAGQDIRFGRRLKPGRAMEAARYEWEITGDYGTFRDLQRHRMVDAWEWQQLTPFLGYEVPQLVAEAGFEQQFHLCFELADELYRQLWSAGREVESQYATLLGHRMRYSFFANLRELFHMLELRTQPSGHFGYRRVCLKMHELLTEVHPRLASGMVFIGKDPDNDVELTRMASELASAERLRRRD